MTLSITVMVSKLFTTWKVRAMPRWQRSAAGSAVTSSPSNTIEPWVGGSTPGDQVEQRRLAGAVGADQADDLAAPDRNRDIAVGDEAAEALPDAAGFQQRASSRRLPCAGGENSPTSPSGRASEISTISVP